MVWPGSYPAESERYALLVRNHGTYTLNSALADALARSEPKLAKRCGYQVKICESSVTQLSKLFVTPTNQTCEREKCYMCQNHSKI